MSKQLTVIIVEKNGDLKTLTVKDFKVEELYKKCGFKKSEDFIKQTEWSSKYEGQKYYIEVYAKTNGRAGFENKYEFPPPIDSSLFFGNCVIFAYLKNVDTTRTYIDLTVPLWKRIYEKLLGGFEDLSTTALEDEEEEDELANVPKEKKTKHGYLKDGFVVDSKSNKRNDDDDDNEDDEDDDENDGDDDDDEIGINGDQDENEDEDVDEVQDGEDVISDVGSELCEEYYEDD
jgi:hypothetical protein